MSHQRELLARRLEAPLDEADERRVREHLAACAECGAFDASLRRSETLLAAREAARPAPAGPLHRPSAPRPAFLAAVVVASLAAALVAGTALVSFRARLFDTLATGSAIPS